MKKSIILYLTSISIAFIGLFSSCVEEIQMSFDNADVMLVVEGTVTTDTTVHFVKLSKTGDALFQNPIQYVSGAVVKISDGINEVTLTENPLKEGEYQTAPNFYGVPGNTYTLNISNVDIDNNGVFENYTAKSELRKENPIDSIKLVFDDSNPDWGGLSVNLFGKDIGGGRNFYLIKAYINNVLVTDSIHEYRFKTDNTGFNGQNFGGVQAYLLNSSKKDEVVKPGDKITLEMDGITEGYFNFINDFILEYDPKIPIFSGPSANISTNIEPKNKAVGFFAAYSISRCSKVYLLRK